MDQNQSLSTETAVYAKFLQVVVDPYNFLHVLTELQLFCKDDINILNKKKFYSRCQLLMCRHDILKGGLSKKITFNQPKNEDYSACKNRVLPASMYLIL